VARPVPQNRATFDLDHIATLASGPGFNLRVSEKTLYVLQNLVALDVADPYRYAEGYYLNGTYDSVADDPTRESDFIDICDLVQEEVYPVGQFEPQGFVVINEIDTYVIGTSGSIDITVPSGKVWVVQGLAMKNEIHPCWGWMATVDPSSGEVFLVSPPFAMPVDTWYSASGNFTLSEGMKAWGYFWDCTDLDHIYLQYHLVEYDT
jgi:hypothetical protein